MSRFLSFWVKFALANLYLAGVLTLMSILSVFEVLFDISDPVAALVLVSLCAPTWWISQARDLVKDRRL